MNNEELFKSDVFKKAVLGVLILLGVFLLTASIGQVKKYKNGGMPSYNAITVNGVGEVTAVPNIATFSYGVSEEGATVTEAQTKATEKHNAAMKYIKDAGVEEKDITVSTSFSPKYEYKQGVCTQYGCPNGKSVIVGYTAGYDVRVKVRNADKAADLITKIGELGASTLSGLTFSVDDEEALKAEARTKAIADAKAKAEKLSEDLGIDIEEIMSYYENPDAMPMYAESMSMDYGGGVMKAAAPTPDLPKGQSKITVNVSVTYRIDD